MNDNIHLRQDFIDKSLEFIRLYGLSEEVFEKVSIELYDDINHFSKLFTDIPDFLNSYLAVESQNFKKKLHSYEVNSESRISDLIFNAIKLKLSIIDKDILEQIIKYLAIHPLSNGLSLDSVYKISDTIWSWLGDNEIDFSFYTKRISLSMIITSTLLYYIKIDNLDNIDNFLRAQLYAFSKIAKIKHKISKCFGN
ncbi:MAG: COQ9 family protein [Rickettsiales bacterium]|jgi:ubiquinone biosynthesis protein COQ9|nr:COQ9 family protein [Rickettsiales bacterium]